MAKNKIRVFIDTNAIIGESFFRSVRASAFLKAATILGIEVVIPEIVVDEVEGNLVRSFQERFDKYSNAHKSLSELAELEEIDLSPSYLIDQINDEMGDLLAEHEVTIPAYPKVAIKKLVRESYRGKKPFKTDGDGYKDFVIWTTIKEYIEKKKGKYKNYFITNNTTDFCENNAGKFVLHSSLVGQLKESSTAPSVFKDLKTLFDDVIAPSLPGLKLKDVASLKLSNLKDRAQTILEDYLAGHTVYGLEECPFINEVNISSVTNEIDVEDISLKEIDADQILIKIVGEVDVDTYGYIDKSSFYIEEQIDSRLYVLNGDHNDHVMEVGANVTTPFELNLTYERSSKKITAQQIELPSEIHGDWY